jgi:hypothetical protein
MELLIAGGIALVGYNLSSEAKPARRPKRDAAPQLGPANQYPSPPQRSTRDDDRDHAAKAAQRWDQARDPQVTGIVSPHTKLAKEMLPFFTSAKSQHTNDQVKQTRMEMFTGATAMDSSLTGVYRAKREVESLFPAATSAGPVTSGGSQGNKAYDPDMERYKPSVLQNNVRPAEQITVGRGVGAGPDVAATDGFHPMYRSLPKNVGEYKKNNLPGVLNHGAPLNAAAPTQAPLPEQTVSQTTGALVYDQERRPMMPSMASVLAPVERADIGGPRAPRLYDVDYFGGPAAGVGPEARGWMENRIGYEGGDNGDRNHAPPLLNLTGAGAGVGAFTDVSYDSARLASQQREAAGSVGFVTGPTARQLPAGQLLPPTQRDMHTQEYFGPSGGGAAAAGQALRPRDDPRVTLRDTQGANPALFGTSAAVKGGALDNVWRYKRLARDGSKRPAVDGRSPQPSRVNAVVDPARAAAGLAVRSDNAQQVAAPFMPSLPNKAYNEDLGARATPSNKLPSANPRLQDLDLAARQLRTNPYAHTLSGA